LVVSAILGGREWERASVWTWKGEREGKEEEEDKGGEMGGRAKSK
jgi:hypothetical protein